MKEQLNRREFVAAAATATALCLCTFCNPADLLADGPAPSTAPATLDAGPKSDYATDGITDTWAKAPNKIAIVRNDGKIYALSTICTHKGGIVTETPDKAGFICPRHHATFDITGTVTKRPAKVALIRFAISTDASGHLIVDKSTQFQQEQWDDSASFVKAD